MWLLSLSGCFCIHCIYWFIRHQITPDKCSHLLLMIKRTHWKEGRERQMLRENTGPTDTKMHTHTHTQSEKEREDTDADEKWGWSFTRTHFVSRFLDASGQRTRQVTQWMALTAAKGAHFYQPHKRGANIHPDRHWYYTGIPMLIITTASKHPTKTKQPTRQHRVI